jgi:uncharacterized membrane protein YoaK (UPF0700 family)
VSWLWLIDVRGDKPRIDWPRLTIVLVVSEIFAGILGRFLTEWVGPLAMLLIALPIVALLLVLDVKLRRRHPDNL